VDLPVLKIKRSAGDDALLAHKLTEEERALFERMDSATSSLSPETDLTEYHRIVSAIGAAHGLTPQQSVAFWTRTTFMVFEA
jgi:hypothetical protein